MSFFDLLATSDLDWCLEFQAKLRILRDNARGQFAAWPADDLVARKRYVACPRRGLHARLADCWMCWCDVAWGHATEADVIQP